jgi:DNA-binding NarL/FixJ family response regulator
MEASRTAKYTEPPEEVDSPSAGPFGLYTGTTCCHCTGELLMPKWVLVVDDNPGARAATRLAFENDGRFYVCGEAVNGQDAIEQARELKPDLIVLDFSMPRMNGIEAARILTREMGSIPLVLFTMHRAEMIEASAREAGFRLVISKDQGMERLVTQSQSLVESQSASD